MRAPGGGRRHAPAATPAKTHQDDQGTLAQIQRLRRRLEGQVADSGLVGILKSLEERVARIEEQLRSGRASARPSRTPADAGGNDDATLRGIVHGQLLADILQLISSNALTGIFAVTSGGITNRMYFDEGQICHAEGPGLSGENALFATLAFEEGTYAFHETNELPEEKSITSNTQFLILEALRRIDEQGEA